MNSKQQQIVLAVIGLIITGILLVTGLKVVMPMLTPDREEHDVIAEVQEGDLPEQQELENNEQPKEYVPVVFIGKNETGDEVYKVVRREYDESIDGAKLRYALTALIMGPKQNERTKGIYSEVPTGTTILHVYDEEDKVIIDLSQGFVYGGGTDSVYKRLFQLIKTVTRNTDKPAYLYIDGKQADVIGGDGIMITQPLSENSIGE